MKSKVWRVKLQVDMTAFERWMPALDAEIADPCVDDLDEPDVEAAPAARCAP